MKLKISKEKEKELIAKFGHVPTEKEISENIKASQEKLMTALVGMLETAPDDPEVRKKLMEAIEKAVEVRNKVYEEVLKETPPPVKRPGIKTVKETEN